MLAAGATPIIGTPDRFVGQPSCAQGMTLDGAWMSSDWHTGEEPSAADHRARQGGNHAWVVGGAAGDDGHHHTVAQDALILERRGVDQAVVEAVVGWTRGDETGKLSGGQDLAA